VNTFIVQLVHYIEIVNNQITPLIYRKMQYKTSQYLVKTDILDEEAEVKQRIIYSSRSGRSVLIEEQYFEKLINNDFMGLPTEMLNLFFKDEFIVPAIENELESIMEQNRVHTEQISTLATTIQPTANCQLGCHYCGQEHRKENMENDLVTKIVNRIKTKIETKEFDLLDVTWYGGEPLLGYSQIKKLSKELMDIAKKNDTDYKAFMITNGLSLKPAIFKELYLNLNVTSFQITLDGTKEHHDDRRVLKKDRGATFDLILANILAITSLPEYTAKSAKPIFIRMNIDKTNYRSITKLIDLFADHGLDDKIGLGFAPIINWGELTSGTDDGLTKEEYAKMEIDWFLYSIKKGFKVIDILPDRSFQPCMVVDKNAEVYDTDGNIFPCYEFSYTPMYQNDDHIIGNLKNDPSTYNQNVTTRDWFNDLQKGEIATCHTCNILPACGGGCVKKWYGENPEPACPTYKFNIEDRLVLQYLNSNKHADFLVNN
jgi:uncharacterized protein